MLPWWIIVVVIALVTALFGVAGPAHGPAAVAQTYFQAFIGISALLLVGRVLGSPGPNGPACRQGSASP